MAYRALYREWRPQTFADMVGQEHVTRTLQNALKTGRFAHAYLFSGPRGTGKTSAAKILAKAINCEQGPGEEPCNRCASCRGITAGTVMDVVEIDAASNRGVDEIRDLRDQVRYAPTEVRYKVYIIDEVHMLTTEAFNALLKTLEEPPAHVMFILATTEPHKIPATILSRCQRFDFHRISGRQIVERLHEIARQLSVEVEEEALWLLARAAEGGMRDALSLFDQAIAFCGERVTLAQVNALLGGIPAETLADLAEAIAHQDMQKGLRLLSELVNRGKDVAQLLHELLLYFRDLLMYQTVPDLQEVQERTHYDPRFAATAQLFAPSHLLELLAVMTETQNELKWQSDGRLLVELLIVRLCQTKSINLQSLQQRLDALEKRMEQREEALSKKQDVPSAMAPEGRRPSVSPAASATFSRRGVPANPAERSAVGIPLGRLEMWLREADGEKLKKVSQEWSTILQQVKKIKITTQAWLSDGEPVAVASGHIVVAFRNQIHRETVMKAVNKEIIERVFAEVLGEPFRLAALLQQEWKEVQGRMAKGTEERNANSGPPKEEQSTWVDEVVKLFGEDLVEIKD